MSCRGTTRAGRKCCLTSDSSFKEAEPLRRGGDYCLFHAQPFATIPCLTECPLSLEVIFLDLETTGVSILEDRVVELAAIQLHSTGDMLGCIFSTTVAVESNILDARGAEAANVHGISHEEISAGPAFPEAWNRFLQFVESLSDNHMQETCMDSDDECAELPTISQEPPIILLAAHNGIKFDFALLFIECYRHRLDMSVFEKWIFVDTMHVMSAVKDVVWPCCKLQCLAVHACDAEELRAHRARDDCVALLRVMSCVAVRLGIRLHRLLHAFGVQVNFISSISQISSMIECNEKQYSHTYLLQCALCLIHAFPDQKICFT